MTAMARVLQTDFIKLRGSPVLWISAVGAATAPLLNGLLMAGYKSRGGSVDCPSFMNQSLAFVAMFLGAMLFGLVTASSWARIRRGHTEKRLDHTCAPHLGGERQDGGSPGVVAGPGLGSVGTLPAHRCSGGWRGPFVAACRANTGMVCDSGFIDLCHTPSHGLDHYAGLGVHTADRLCHRGYPSRVCISVQRQIRGLVPLNHSHRIRVVRPAR